MVPFWMLWSLTWSLVEFKDTQQSHKSGRLSIDSVVLSIWGGAVGLSLHGYLFTYTQSVVWVFTTVGIQDAAFKDEHPG